MSDVFISYAHGTAKQAQTAAEALRALGYSVWLDDDLPAHRNYSRVIEEQLGLAKAALVIWSAEAAKSDWVLDEADRAREQGKLVQVTVDKTRLPMPFGQIQCADLVGWSGDADAAGWRKAVDSIAALVGGEPKRAPDDIAPAPRTTAEPLLAVLPFDNLSTDPEMQFFSDGVSEELLQRLMQGAKLKVIGRTSSFQFRGADKSVRKVAAELNASHILDGSVRRAAGRVRITAHLVEAASQTTLWSDRYDRSLEDIFAVQDEISESIASALDLTFRRASPAAISPEAYDLYLRGIEPTFDPEEGKARMAMLEEVTRLEPHFANAWGRLAAAGADLRYFLPHPERAARAADISAQAARALSLDPHNEFARSAQFWLLPPFGQFIEQETLTDQLQHDAPETTDTFSCAIVHNLSVGRLKDALQSAERALARDVLNRRAIFLVGLCQWFGGRSAEAKTIFEAVLALRPDQNQAAMDLVMLSAQEGDWATVDAMLAPDRLAKYPLQQHERAAIAYVSVMRDPAPASRRRPIESAKRQFERTGCAELFQLAWAAELGAVDESYDIAEKARFGPAGDSRDTMGGDAYRTHFLFHAMHAAIRRDPRLVRLCARLGLVEYWTTTQKWPDCADEVPYDFRAECEKARGIPKQAFGF